MICRSSRKELPVALHLPKVEAEVLLPQPKAGSSAGDDGNNVDESSDEASLAELGVKVFPNMPPQSAANTWVRFVNNAKACINHYNKKYQASGKPIHLSRLEQSIHFYLWVV
jgi:hypothetical protein